MFRKQFKKYKSRCPPPDLSDVLDMTKGHPKLRPLSPAAEVSEGECVPWGMRAPQHWRLWTVGGSPGLLALENPFTPAGQRRWVRRCLRDFTRKPGCRLNLDLHHHTGGEGEDWWTSCLLCSDLERRESLLRKLRWSTLGYHHNWDTKVYSESRRDAFPEDLASLSRVVARATGFPNFQAQAAIVNFYHLDSTLSGHTDHSETYLEAPLLSFSFGQTALFLVGGTTLEEEPTALFLRSGDVLVMSGQSRLCYHAVPRIIPRDTPPPWEEGQDDPEDYYLQHSRINVNVRQVLRPGEQALPSS